MKSSALYYPLSPLSIKTANLLIIVLLYSLSCNRWSNNVIQNCNTSRWIWFIYSTSSSDILSSNPSSSSSSSSSTPWTLSSISSLSVLIKSSLISLSSSSLCLLPNPLLPQLAASSCSHTTFYPWNTWILSRTAYIVICCSTVNTYSSCLLTLSSLVQNTNNNNCFYTSIYYLIVVRSIQLSNGIFVSLLTSFLLASNNVCSPTTSRTVWYYVSWINHLNTIHKMAKWGSSFLSTGSTNSYASFRSIPAKWGIHPTRFNYGLSSLASSISLIYRFSSSSAFSNAYCISCFATSNWLFRDMIRGVGGSLVGTGWT